MSGKLPARCYVVDPADNEVIIVSRYGRNVESYNSGRVKGWELAMKMNNRLGVSRKQAQAMLAGLLDGWDSQNTDPSLYDDAGNLK